MGIQQGYDLIRTIMTDMIIFDISWFISALITFLVLLFITKEVGKWKTLAFPVMVLIHIMGVPPFILLYVASAIVFAIESLSLQTIGALLSIVKLPKPVKSIEDIEITRSDNRRRRKEVKDIFKNAPKGFDVKNFLNKGKGSMSDKLEEMKMINYDEYLRRLKGKGRI